MTVPTDAQNLAPVVSSTLPALTAVSGTTNGAISLNTYFKDPDVAGTAVRLSMVYSTGTTSYPIVTGTYNIDLALFDADAPITVTNFLGYVNNKYYDGSFIHRTTTMASAGLAIIQGGAFQVIGSGTNFNLYYVNQGSTIQNEYSTAHPNAIGTIAMAKQSGDANSASNQWFINISDNSSTLDAYNNGGFTVFGRVLGNGMTWENQIDALPVFSGTTISSALVTWPLGGRGAGNYSTPLMAEQMVIVRSATVIPALTYSSTSSNTAVVTPSISSSGTLSLQYARVGSAQVTVTATDLDGATVSSSFLVTVLPPTLIGSDANNDHIPDNWQAAYGLSTTGNTPGLDSDKDGIPDFLEYAIGTNPTVPDRSSLPLIQRETVSSVDYLTIQFNRRRGAAINYIVEESTDLVTWQVVNQTTNAIGTATDLGNGFDHLKFRGNNAISGSGKVAKSFLRLKVVSQ